MVETWACGDKAVLYSDDSQVWQAALEAGLKPMAEYRRPDGVLFAKQFVWGTGRWCREWSKK
ncbi:hypothetical protein GFC01_09505 [Desulfofundulus thermobenzoicus]|uniref:Uncharacterized protein n=1 Tax=Desulfofundulus thermobenzoicus TaxID=29376 RepID=A0A6N7IR32_9FIRM|nr:hypothetical protein [Desulfofundulus thermobenzoicus]MQL52492.1 hypothetical protein [Desulfofundulus thermobenzoicus]